MSKIGDWLSRMSGPAPQAAGADEDAGIQMDEGASRLHGMLVDFAMQDLADITGSPVWGVGSGGSRYVSPREPDREAGQ